MRRTRPRAVVRACASDERAIGVGDLESILLYPIFDFSDRSYEL